MPPNCLLVAIPNSVNTFIGKTGKLKMVVKQVKGRTDIDCGNSSVTDITNPANEINVAKECDQSSLSFQMDSGKKYKVLLTFNQLVDPVNAQADLNEECGQNLDTITVTNLFPRYDIEVPQNA